SHFSFVFYQKKTHGRLPRFAPILPSQSALQLEPSRNQAPPASTSSERLYGVTRSRTVLLSTIASHADTAKPAAASSSPRELHPIPSSAPPTNGPTIEPKRPTPSAQPTPVDLTDVG